MNKQIKEDGVVGAGAPTNAVSTGQVAGLGVGPKGEPGVPKKKKGVIPFSMFVRRKPNVAS